MVIANKLKEDNLHLLEKAKKVKLVLTDNDGVLTDTGVYYSERGEEMKRFSIRDGMGVERLRNLLNIETGIVTGELSGSVKKRAEKLKIKELYLGAKEKHTLLQDILNKNNIAAENIAYIDDEVIATQALNYNKPGRFFDVEYKIPGELVKDKSKITVKFLPKPGNLAGGVFGVRIIK